MRKKIGMFCFTLMLSLAIGFAGSTPGYAQTEAVAAEFGDGVGEQGIGEISEETPNIDDVDSNVETDNTNADETEFDDSDIPEVSVESDVNVANTETLTYTHSDTATQNGVTLKVEWNDPVLGEDTTFHVSATGGSGSYMFRMDAPSYSDPDKNIFECVADPARGEWTKFTELCVSHDYSFKMTASGIYKFRFHIMDMPVGVTYLRTDTNIQVSDPKYPSVGSIVSNAVEKCNSETNGSDYKKALWLHDWLLQQLEYDRSLKWSSAESALTRRLGTCQAYESAYAKLLTAAGIENAETRDTADGHTWNAMKLDGKWYQVDCTWDDEYNNYYNLDSTKLYFGLTDELMALAHPGHTAIYTGNEYKTRSTSLADNYFVRHGEAAEWAHSYADRIQNQLNSKVTEFTIVADNESYPPSISGIQNGIIAYAMNQMKWTADGQEVTLNAVGKDKEFTFVPVYSNSIIGDSFYGYTLNLDGTIAINMYMDLPEKVASNNDAYMEFTIPGVRTSKVTITESKRSGKHYIFTFRVAAKEMAQDVKAKMMINGISGKVYTVSVQKYAQYILNHPNDYPSTDANLVKSMLNYGAATQILFNYQTNNIANSILDSADQIISEPENIFDAFKSNVTVPSNTGINWYGGSLVLESDTCIRNYFVLDNSASINNYSFWYNNSSLQPVERVIDGTTYYYVEISNIKAQNLEMFPELSVKKAGNIEDIITVRYNAFSYAYDLKNSTNPDKETLAVTYALYQYSKMAQQFVKENNSNNA